MVLVSAENKQNEYTLPGFEGPLDLLLHLVQKNKYDIVSIPISELLDQYAEKIEEFKKHDIEVATAFLDMMARLVYIKSALLLPKHENDTDLGVELSGELIEYQICKEMALKLGKLFVGWDLYLRENEEIEIDETYTRKHSGSELVSAYLSAVGRGRRRLPPESKSFSALVERDIVPVSRKIIAVLRKLYAGKPQAYYTFFADSNSRSELVATFLAILELIKARRIYVTGSGDDLMIKMRTSGSSGNMSKRNQKKGRHES